MSFFETLTKCKGFHWNVSYVSDGGYLYMCRQFFNALVKMGSISYI